MAASDQDVPRSSGDGVAVSTPLVLAIADYEIPGKGFLPLHANDVILVLEADPSGWWLGMNTTGKKGVLPSTYTVPYVFPVPRRETVEELELLRLAADYGVDLTSGAPSLPPGNKVLSHSGTPLDDTRAVRNIDDLYPVVDSAIMVRESRRGDLTSSLKLLRQARTGLANLTSVDTSLETSSDTHSAYERECQLLDDAQQEREKLLKSFNSLLQSMRSVKRLSSAGDDTSTTDPLSPATGELTGVGCTVHVPPHSWYHRCRQLLATTVGTRDAAIDDAFTETAELSDVKYAVQSLESALERLAEGTKSAELQYRTEKESLQHRIQQRDDAVSRMLAWWAERAEEARAQYLTTKAQRLRQAEVGEREVSEINHTLEERRHFFTRLATELEEAREAAKETKRLLQSRDELSELEAKIKAVNEHLGALRRSRPKQV